MLVACAPPRALRHRPQWQLRARIGSPSLPNATAPPQQPPRGAPGGSRSGRSAPTGASMPGGNASNAGRPSRISHQGAFDAANMWNPGRTTGSPSSVPYGMKLNPADGSPGNAEPQRAQNQR